MDCQLWVCWCAQTDKFKLNLSKKEHEKNSPVTGWNLLPLTQVTDAKSGGKLMLPSWGVFSAKKKEVSRASCCSEPLPTQQPLPFMHREAGCGSTGPTTQPHQCGWAMGFFFFCRRNYAVSSLMFGNAPHFSLIDLDFFSCWLIASQLTNELASGKLLACWVVKVNSVWRSSRLWLKGTSCGPFEGCEWRSFRLCPGSD